MKYKTKTIMWEDNNEPPKNYIWAKPDGKFYEYSYVTRSWIESKLIKAEESGGSNGGVDILDTWPWNGFPKPVGFINCTDSWYENSEGPFTQTVYDIDDLTWDLFQELYVPGNALKFILLYDSGLMQEDKYGNLFGPEVIGYITTGPLDHGNYSASNVDYIRGNLNTITTVNDKEYATYYDGE